MTMNPPILRDAQDLSFFRMDPFEGLSLEVLDEAAPTGVVIGGAKRWDPAVEPAYPLVAAIKGVRPYPVGFLIKRYGNVLVRNLSSGSLAVRQAWSNDGKMPLYRPQPQPEVPSRTEEMESTVVARDWLKLGADHANVPTSDLEITMMFGDVLSNSVIVSTGSPGVRWEDTVGWHAARLPLSAEERVDPRFAPDDRCPVLTSPGIAWKLLEGQDGRFGLWPLALAFCVEESSLQGGALRIPLHLVFAWLGSSEALHLDIQVPLERTRASGTLRYGNFLMDLYPLFQEPQAGIEIIPKHLNLLAMCGKLRQGPLPLPVGVGQDI